MKNISLTTWIWLFLNLFANGQEPVIGSTYTMKEGRRLKECKVDGEIIAGNDRTITTNTEIAVVNKVSAGYVIKVLPFKEEMRKIRFRKMIKKDREKWVSDRKQWNKDLKTSINDQGYYLLPTVEADYLIAAQRHLQANIGTLTLPFKIRSEGRDSISATNKDLFLADANLNLSISLGLRLYATRSNQFELYAVGGFGVTSIGLTSKTTNGFLDNELSASAFTPYGGLLISFQGVNLLGVIGKDNLMGEVRSHWIYYNKYWIGLGLGLNLLKVQTSGQPRIQG